MLALDWLLLLVGAWLATGFAGLLAPRNIGVVTRLLYPLGALIGLGIAAVAFVALAGAPQVAVLPLGLPDLPFHLRLDALSAFFLLLLGGVGAAISIYSAGYLKTAVFHGALSDIQ